jgi:hypothetical protein
VLSGSGWLFPWHVGVVSALAKEGLLKKESINSYTENKTQSNFLLLQIYNSYFLSQRYNRK